MASPVLKRLQRTFTRFHVFLYHISRGKIGGRAIGLPVLMLTTIGRKSGKARTTPVGFIHRDGEYLVAATSSGSAQNPTWFSNLKSNPEAAVEINGRQIKVHALIASGDERDQLYEVFKATHPSLGWIEKRTAREIPVIRLQPVTTVNEPDRAPARRE